MVGKNKIFPQQKEKPANIREYIHFAPKQTQTKLRELYTCLRGAAPGAEENIKWGVPAFSYKRILFTFTGFKQHIGFYPTPSVIRVFKKDLESYNITKSSIKFTLDKPLPKGLIKKVAQFRIKELQEKDAKWM